MFRATIVYRSPNPMSSVKQFEIHLSSPDPEQIETEIAETLADLKHQGLKARVIRHY